MKHLSSEELLTNIGKTLIAVGVIILFIGILSYIWCEDRAVPVKLLQTGPVFFVPGLSLFVSFANAAAGVRRDREEDS